MLIMYEGIYNFKGHILLTFAHFETMLRGDIPKKTRNFLSDCL